MGETKISVTDTVLILTISMGLILLSIILKVSISLGFLGGICAALIVLMIRGYSITVLMEMIYDGLKECRLLFLLILLIGATVSVWLSSGIVPTMIYYGFKYMEGLNYLFAAFIITSFISYFMGTAVGTISTIGIALLGIGRGFGIPEKVVLGCIVSGAFIADKISPISGLLNLTLSTTKIPYKTAIKSMARTFIPVYFITLAGYYFIGNSYRIGAGSSQVEAYQSAIFEHFYISPFLILIPIGVLILLMLGVRTIQAISAGLLVGIAASVGIQSMTIPEVVKSIIWGFRLQGETGILSGILKSGGIAAMVEVILIVGGAISLSSLLEKTGITRNIINKIVEKVQLKGNLILKTGLISSILTIVTCDQTVGIILPGRLLRDKYDELGVEQTVLTRTISDTGTIIAPLMPWNVNALIIGLVSSISSVDYAPYALLCYIFPIMTLVLSYLLIREERKGLSKGCSSI